MYDTGNCLQKKISTRSEKKLKKIKEKKNKEKRKKEKLRGVGGRR